MEVRLEPDLQAKLDRWTAETGRAPDDLIREAMAGYFEALAVVRSMLDERYDEMKGGTARPIDGAEAVARLRARSKKHRAERAVD